MWRVWRAARAAYTRRPNPEWRESGIALGIGRGSIQVEATGLPDQSKRRTLNTHSTACFRQRLDASNSVSGPLSRNGENLQLNVTGAGIAVREFSGAACAHCLSGRPHSCRGFSSQVGDEAPDEEAAQDEDNVSEDDDDEDVPDKGTVKEKKNSFRKRGETEAVTQLWAKISRIPTAKTEAVLPVILKWKADGKTLTKPEVVAIIRRAKKQGRFKLALALSEWAETEFPEEFKEGSVAGRIELLSRMRQLTQAEAAFEAAAEKTGIVYNALHAAYVNSGNVAKAEALFETMKKEGIATKAYPFNQMLICYKRKDQADKVKGVVDDMKARGVAFDSYTYNILIDMEAKAGKIDKVDELYEQMKSDPGVALDAATCGCLAAAYVSAGQEAKGEEFLKMLGHLPFPKKQPAYEMLIRMFATLDTEKYVEKVWDMIKRSPIVAIQSYICMIDAYGRLGQTEKAEKIFAEMEKERGLQVPSQFNAMLGVYTKSSENMGKAEELVARMDGHTGVHRNALTFHKLITSYLKYDQFDKAVEVLKSVQTSTKRSRAVPWHETLYLMLEAYALKGDVGNAEKQFQGIKQVYRKASTKTYNALLTAYVTARQHPGAFAERMAAESVEPNDETRNLLDKVRLVTESSDVAQAVASE